MPNTIQTSINAVQGALSFWVPTVGTGNEPAISAANMTQQVMLSPPFRWPWNRNSLTFTTVQGTQDYTQSVTDFGYAEKATIAKAGGQTFELKVLNTEPLGESVDQSRPTTLAVQLNIVATSVTVRLLSVPDAVYTVKVTYQKFVPNMATLGAGWTAPDYLSFIYNRGFLAHLYEARGDMRSQQEKIAFAAALLGNQEGLSETEKNIFLSQYLPNPRAVEAAQLRTQQGIAARGQ